MDEINSSVTEQAEVAETETQQEVAAPVEEETSPPEGENAGVADQQEEEKIPDKVWATARKKAEAEFQKRYERETAERNAAVAKRFAGVKNPKTGAEIKTEQDYWDALDAQKEIRAEQARQRVQDELRKNGVDVNILNQAIENSPAVQKANQIIAENERLAQQKAQEEGERLFNEQFAAIQKIDTSIKTVNDLQKMPEFEQFDAMVKQGYDLVSAFKSCCFDRIMASQKDAGKQSAINAQRSNAHLRTTGGGAVPSEKGGVPADQMAFYRENFPGKTDKQLNELWRMTHK